jgi:hypothetical protein
MSDRNNCQCSCGKVQFGVHGRPLMRGFCHCTICQTFNQAPYADITLFRGTDVDLPGSQLVEYRTYRAPPAVQRGKCRACGRPAVEYLRILALPTLVIVPSANLLDRSLIPKADLHIFYDRRVADIDDDLPKFQGYFASQGAFGRKLVSSLVHREASA